MRCAYGRGMTTREKMTMGWMAILILGCETTHGCPDSSALNPPGPGLEASVLDSGFSSDQLDGMASEASTADEDPIRDAGGDDAWVSDARADALPPRLMGECPPGATFITRPLRNLANGYGVDFALAPGETRTFCARVTAPTIPDGTHLSVLRFIWNDVADYECNEAQVTVT